MKKLIVSLALVALVLTGGTAFAVVGANDAVPAASLLLPYFEVDLAHPGGMNTLFSIVNASATATVAHVVLWTDQSVPTLDFDVYLTGYDVQTISVRDIFNGILPRTADDTADPANSIDTPGPTPTAVSNQGALSPNPLGDINFPGSTGPCISPAYDPLASQYVVYLQRAHTGLSIAAPFTPGCYGYAHGDNVARGYITIDNVLQCNLAFPGDPGYFAPQNIISHVNQLWGDYFYVNADQNFAQGETLVHLESGFPATPIVPTFYERYNAVSGEDYREGLPNQWATRYLNGGGFTGGTDLIIWRDSETISVPYNCSLYQGPPNWFPLGLTDVVGFDEVENPEDLCGQSSTGVSPPIVTAKTCIPLEAQRINVETGNAASDPIDPTPAFGWLYLNLEHAVTGAPNYPGQSWVVAVMSAQGRFSVGFDAIALAPAGTTGPALIP